MLVMLVAHLQLLMVPDAGDACGSSTIYNIADEEGGGREEGW
jgi:hypothetical protein